MDHKHLMRVQGTVELNDKSWTRMVCGLKGCTHYRLVEHGWFQQLDRTWKKI